MRLTWKNILWSFHGADGELTLSLEASRKGSGTYSHSASQAVFPAFAALPPGPQAMGATPFLVGLGGGSGGKPKIREDLLFFPANSGIAREREEEKG